VIYDLAHSCVTPRKMCHIKCLNRCGQKTRRDYRDIKLVSTLLGTLPPKGASELVWDALIHNLILNDGT
jgi:hypothetical protein